MPAKSKPLWICLLVLILTLGFLPVASANSWGLSGTLIRFVQSGDLWNDYSANAEFYKKDIPVTAAILRNRYHAVLMVGRKSPAGQDEVWLSTTAVYQPQDAGAPLLALSCTGDTVTLYTPEQDSTFTFSWDTVLLPEGGWLLTKADHGDVHLRLTPEEGLYRINDSLLWQAEPVTLESFSIARFPDTVQDILHMNRIYAELRSASGFWQEARATRKAVKLPVYAAPSADSYRAAKGKASVNLKGGVTLMATMGDWDLVSYEVSARTRRIGWIEGQHLGDPAPILFTDFPVRSADFLTDDPQWSQYRSFDGTELTGLHLMALLNPFYAYARAVTSTGQVVWGFVPVDGVTLPAQTMDPAAMEELTGTWIFSSGGELTATVLRLQSDGSCEMLELREDLSGYLDELPGVLTPEMLNSAAPTLGTWCVIDSLSNNGCGKTLLLHENGVYQSLSLYAVQQEPQTGDLSMTLTQGEAGGTWVRIPEQR